MTKIKSTGALLADLRTKGISLRVEGEDLCFDAPKGAMTPDIANELRRRKQALIAFLKKAGQLSQAARGIPAASRQKPLPLSFEQQQLWLMDQLNKGQAAYNVPVAVALHGNLDVTSLQKAIHTLVSRHEILRTVYAQTEEDVVQVILDPEPLDIAIDDLTKDTSENRERKRREALERAATTSFDLASEVPLKATILGIGANEHLLILVLHHIVTDGWTMGLLVRELSGLYEAFAAGKPSPLPPLSIQYADYAVWQRDRLSGERYQQERAFWIEKLDGIPSGIDLPLDNARRSNVDFEGSDVSIKLPAARVSKLKELSRKAGVSPFIPLLANLFLLLGKWSDQEDLVIGTVIAGRNQKQTHNLIGCFMNFLALRARLTPDATIQAFLEQVKAMVQECYAHDEFPYEKIVEALAPNRKDGSSTVYNVAFLYQNFPEAPSFGSSIEAETVPLHKEKAFMDLRFIAMERNQEITLVCEFRSGLFAEETIRLLLASFSEMLGSILEDTAKPLHQLSPSKELMERASVSRQRGPRTMAIAATFTAEPAEDALSFWLKELDLPYKPTFAPYNQVFRELLAPDSLLSQNKNGINVLFVRFEDWHSMGEGLLPSVSEQELNDKLADRPRHVLPNNIEIAHLNRYETEYLYQEIFIDRVYKRQDIILEEGACIFDVGANIGLCTLFMTQHVKNARIFSFEPAPHAYDRLATNVSLYCPGATAFKFGLGAREEDAKFTFYPRSSVFSSYFAEEEQDEKAIRAIVRNMLAKTSDRIDEKELDRFTDELMKDRLEKETVVGKIRTISNVIREQKIRRIDLLKVDVEKSELPVLHGIDPEHWALIQQIIIEVHDQEGPIIAEVMGILEKQGFLIDEMVEEELLSGSGLYNIYAFRERRLRPERTLEEQVSDFTRALRASTSRSSNPHLLMLCPPSPAVEQDPQAFEQHERLANRLEQEARTISGLTCRKWDDVINDYPVAELHDSHGDSVGKIPYTAEGFAALSTVVVRTLNALTQTPYKVIVLDCDNTLWGGVCGEVGAHGVSLSPAFVRLQAFMNQQLEAGMLLCLASKNNPDDVFAVFQRDDMILLREHIVSHRINWMPKSQNIQSLALELELGLDSFIFLDDNPLEIAEVQANCPTVLSLQLPGDEQDFDSFLQHVWAFDHLTVTEEDKKRSDMYRQNVERESVRTTMTFADFIGDLDLEIKICEMGPEDLARSSQMTMRTNQFNMSTIRRSEAQLRRDCGQAHTCFTTRVRDRFGNYGQVGLLIVKPGEDALQADTFLLSCRALGRGVEHRMLARLGEHALSQGLSKVVLTWLPTERNQPALRFLETTLEAWREDLPESGRRYAVPAETAATITFEPQDQQPEVLDSDHSNKKKAVRTVPPPFQLIAQYTTMARILDGIDDFRHASSQNLARESLPPRNPTEELICNAWADVLGLDRVGINDHFFQLGGHSLQATRVISRLRTSLNVEFSLQDIFNLPTVAQLAGWIQKNRLEKHGISLPPIEAQPRTAEEESIHPLSFAQKRLWFVEQLMNPGATYNMPSALRIRGGVNIKALETAFSRLILEQESLRTVFTQLGDDAVQIIRPAQHGPVPMIDLRRLGAESANREALRLSRAHGSRRFNLETGPLFLYSLMILEDDHYALLLNMHHIISDGWSSGVLVRKLIQHYEAARTAKPAPAGPVVQYADYAYWQRKCLTESVQKKQLDFWLHHLSDAPRLLDLPLDHPRPNVQSYTGDGVPFELGVELSGELEQLARRHGFTVFMILETAFAILLQRYSFQQKVVLGTSFANRNQEELEDLIGFFVNSQALCNDLSGAPTFLECLLRGRKLVLEASAHHDIPFDQVVAALEPDRDLSYSPVFQVMFVFQNTPSSKSRVSEMTVEPLGEVEHFPAQFDLTLSMGQSSAGLFGFLVYSTSIFERNTIKRFTTHFRTLLASGVANPNRPIAALALMEETERVQCLETWNQTERAFQATLVHELFQQRAAANPHAPALIWEDEQWSYSELNERGNRLAHFLIEQGVGPEKIVAFSMRRSPEAILAILAILAAGAAYVPIDPDYPLTRIKEMVADTGIDLVLTQSQWTARWNQTDVRTVCLNEGCSAEGFFASYPTHGPTTTVDPRNLAYIIYTSGSTGKSKGVMISHQSLANQISWRKLTFDIGLDDRVLLIISLNFDPSVWHIFWSLSLGAALVLPFQGIERDPPQLANYIYTQKISVTAMVPSLARSLIEQPIFAACSHLKHISCGGEALPIDLQKKFLAVLGRDNVLEVVYGPTEATIDATSWSLKAAASLREAIIGRPISNTRVYVRDPSGEPTCIGIEGELYLAGQHLGRGYLNQPTATALKYLPDPFSEEPGGRLYRTGDLARWSADGDLEFKGRMDRQVKVRGFRIELGEIEAKLAAHPNVNERLVIVREDQPNDRQLVVYATGDWQTGDLHGYLSQKLPEHMVPSAYVKLKTFPLTDNGKVDLKALPKPGQLFVKTMFVPPINHLEEMVSGIWARVLGLERVSVESSFFESGGHSLLATRIISQIRETFSVELPLRVLFETPTVRAMAIHLDSALRGDRAELTTIPAYPDDTPAPLTYSQQRLWFLDRLEGASATYNMPVALLLEGNLNTRILEEAVNRIAHRHHSLRAYFPEIDLQPVQLIADQSPAIEKVSLQHLTDAQAESELRRLAGENARQPFDLAVGPLLRVSLVRLNETKHALLLCMHHIIADGWSIGILVREFTLIYQALHEDRAAMLADLTIQYTDFARWQKGNTSGLEAKKQFWKEYLGDAPPLLDLPTDRPRPGVQTFRGATRPFTIAPDLSRKLIVGGHASGSTLFMILESAFALLLSRYSGQTDIVIGTPVANRNRTEIEPLIGLFINTLAMRLRVDPDNDFQTLLKNTRGVSLDAFLNQDLPFEQIVELLKPERSLAHGPIFQVMFILQNATDNTLELPDLKLSHLSTQPLSSARFDITLQMIESEQGIRGSFQYNIDLFDAASIERMVTHFQIILRAITEHPRRPISQIDLMTPAERSKLELWNQTAGAYQHHVCLNRLFEDRVAQNPLAPGLEVLVGGDWKSWTMGDLEEKANGLAAELRAQGVGCETGVGLYLEPSAEMIVAMLAIWKAGGVLTPLEPSHPAERCRFMAQAAGLEILLTDETHAAKLPLTEARVIQIKDQYPHTDPLPALASSHNLAYLMFTSGSTGRPKGVAVPHSAIANRLLWADRTYQLGAKFLQTASYGFDIAIWEIMAPLMQGGTLVLLPRADRGDAGAIIEVIRERAITAVHFIPSLLDAVLRNPHFRQIRTLQQVFCGGEALLPETLERYRAQTNQPLHHFYGPTEAAINATTWDCGLPVAYGVSIGKPITNLKIVITSRDGALSPLGTPGEICIGGLGLARGYHGLPARTAQAFTPDVYAAQDQRGSRLYRTGDLGRWTAAGFLIFMGRIDHQVKIRGHRIEPGEIEAVIARYAGVEAAVVVPVGVNQDLRLIAYVAGDESERADLLIFLEDQLPTHMVPSALLFLETLPLTPNGKLDRKRLPEYKPEADRDTYLEPRTKTEQRLAVIWGDLLQIPQIGARDHFFHLGGHSLLATRVVSEIRETFGTTIGLRVLFANPRLEQLARAIEQAGTTRDQAPPLAPATRPEQIPLSFAQQRLWFIDQFEGPSPMYNIAFAVRFHGQVSVSALERAFSELVDRHESFRTTFREKKGVPFQIISIAGGFRLPLLDFTAIEDPDLAKRLADRDAGSCFNLARGPLFRATLLKQDQLHVLLINMHHIISDGWSSGIMLRELSTLYNAFSRNLGETSPLPVPVIQYSDYSIWQQSWLKGRLLESQLAYWRTKLAGAPALLELPTDRPRPAYQTTRGNQYEFRLDATRTTSLHALARENEATLFMVLSTGLSALLARYSGQNDISLGTSVANRNYKGIEDLIGFFVNTLVLRNHIDATDSFSDLLKRFKETALEAFDHQDVPFEKVVDGTQPTRSPSHTPLFQVMIELQNATGGKTVESQPSDLVFSLMETKKTTALFDLTLNMIESDGGIRAALEYNSDLYSRETITRMARHFKNLLSAASHSPHQPLSELPIMDAAERVHILERLNETAVAFPMQAPFHQLLDQRSKSIGNQVAFQMLSPQGQSTLSYSRLERRTRQLAQCLRQEGVTTQTLVALIADRSLDFVIGMIAIFRAGGVYLPVDPTLPAQRRGLIFEESGVTLALVSETMTSIDIEHKVRLLGLEGLLEKSLRSREIADIPISPDQLAYVIYTSGSTGIPKGVMVTHKGMLNHLLAKVEDLSLHGADVIAQNASQSFDISVWQFLASLLVGGRTHIIANEVAHDPPRLLAETNERGVTILETVPSLLAIALEATTENRPALKALRWMIPTGEALPPVVVRRWLELCPHVPLLNAYGPTECSDDVSHQVIDQAPPEYVKNMPIGTPIANTRLYIVDQQFQPLPIGIPGELLVGGVGIGRGYLNRPSRTAISFIPDPFGKEQNLAESEGRLYRTGDLCRFLGNGAIEFLGRIDHQVKIRGFRIELGEIETLLSQQPEVREAAVLVREANQKQLVAYIATSDRSEPEQIRARLTATLRNQLPDYMIPSSILLLEKFPLMPTGKVDRKTLARLDLPPDDEDLHESIAAPANETEEILVLIWASVLERDRIGMHTNFFEAGGHSLLAVRLLSRVREAFGTAPSLRLLFENPTVTKLAALMRTSFEDKDRRPPMMPAPRQEHNVLSFAQQRLWFLDKLEGPSTTYNIPVALEFEGDLNPLLLARAITALFARHEIFRAVFPTIDGEPIQRMGSNLPEPATIDLSGLEPEAGRRTLHQLAERVAHRIFDLESGPLIHIHVVRVASQRHALLASLHHIITDGWSMDLIIKEITSLYASLLAGEEPQEASAALQYADFAIWQRNWLRGEVLTEQLSWWRNELEGLPELHQVATDFPRPAMQTFNGDNFSFDVPADVARALSHLAVSSGATQFMLMQAAFAVLLARYSGQNDIAVGTPVANRNERDTQNIIGLFANTLTLRNRLEQNPSFLELLARTRRLVLQAHDHGEVPFEKVVETLHLGRNLGYSPLFQVLFIFQNTPETYGDWSGTSIRPLNMGPHTTARFDLTLTLQDTPNGFHGVFEYNTDLFAQASIARMATHFNKLLEGILQRPDRPVSQTSLLDEGMRQELLSRWNQTRVEGHHQPIHHLIRELARSMPDKQAVCMAGAPELSLTYAELQKAANRLAHHLISLYIDQATPVALYVSRSPDMIVGLLGILQSGHAYVPLDPTYPAERLAYMLTDSGAEVMVTGHALPPLPLQTPVTNVIMDGFASQPETDIDQSYHPQQLAYIIYTSGSTGHPKGVQISHKALANFLGSMSKKPGLTDRDTLLAVTTLSFDIAGLEIYLPLLTGARLVLADQDDVLDGARLGKYLEDHEVTAMQATPTGWRLLLESGWRGKSDLAILCGGEALPTDLAIQLRERGKSLWNLYGPTETTIWSTLLDATRDADASGKPLMAIGSPLDNTSIYILDNLFEPAPINVAGALFIGGEGLARGYRNQPVITAEKFLPDPFSSQPGARLYHTGDIARGQPDGNIDFLGRADAQVKLRGFRIELGEIESVFNSLPEVEEAVAVIREDRGTQRLVVYIRSANEVPALEILREKAADRLPNYMVPSAFDFLERFPLTPNGKVDRRALPALASQEIRTHVAPRNRLELQLTGLWERILGQERIGVDDDFFERGGHSVLAVRLVSLIEKEMDLVISITNLFGASTPRALAKLLAAGVGGESSPLVGLKTTGGRAPLFLIHPAGGSAFSYLELSRLAHEDQPIYGIQSPAIYSDAAGLDSMEAIAEHYIQHILEIQHEGPYFIGGWSSGGIVAYEMARRLKGKNREVGLLAMLDTERPDLGDNKPDNLDLMINMANVMVERDLNVDKTTLVDLDEQKQLEELYQLAGGSAFFGEDVPVSRIRKLWDIFRLHALADLDYRPGHYHGDILFIKASERDELEEEDPAAIWQRRITGRVNVWEIEGSHQGLVKLPGARETSEALENGIRNRLEKDIKKTK